MKLLEGVRIIDLSRVLAGPWCTQLLADLGAEVIKVERPGAGDDTRGWGPPWVDSPAGRSSAYYLCANRGKRAIAIDFATPEGQQLVRDLAAQSDVVVENFKVGALARYGLGADDLRLLNPALVYCSITGFGQDGPYAARPGYDFIVQGMGGLMSVTGSVDGGPMKAGVALSDIMTGLYACNAILAALLRRKETGLGAHIDASLLDVTVAALANQALNYFATGTSPVRYGNAHPNIVPYQSFKAKDAVFNVAVGNDGQFSRLCQAIGRPEIATDQRFARNGLRAVNKPALDELLADAFAAQPVTEWLDRLAKAEVPAGPINDVAQVFADPQVQSRGLQISLDHPLRGPLPGVACPVVVDGERQGASLPPPLVGEHTDSVLRQILGRSSEALDDMRGRGVIA